MRFDRNANLTLNIFHTVYPELYPKARSKQFMMHLSISFTATLAVLVGTYNPASYSHTRPVAASLQRYDQGRQQHCMLAGSCTSEAELR